VKPVQFGQQVEQQELFRGRKSAATTLLIRTMGPHTCPNTSRPLRREFDYLRAPVGRVLGFLNELLLQQPFEHFVARRFFLPALLQGFRFGEFAVRVQRDQYAKVVQE
jgi:hypothetical protein